MSGRSTRQRDEPGGLIRFLLTVGVLAWLLRSFLVATYDIPSGSMLPTLYIGDYLAVSKWPYGYSRYSFPFHFPPIGGRVLSRLPKRGDIVVFWVPSEGQDLIKRVIGLPGDTVAVRNGVVILNGKPLPRQQVRPFAMPISANSPCRPAPGANANIQGNICVDPAYRESIPGGPSYIVLDQVEHGPEDDFPTTRVPAGHVFMMGDNRDDSLDSRFSVSAGGIGFIPIEDLVGRADLIFWSTNGTASYFKPWTWFSALRTRRVGSVL
jgi:signal peptidase I